MPDVLSKSTFIEAYLDRIRVESPRSLDLPALNALQLAHLRHVPIDNSALVLGQQHAPSVVEQVISQKRGAAATALNVLFGLLLTGLGFQTRLIATTNQRATLLAPEAVVGVRLDHAWYISDVSGASGDHVVPLDARTQTHLDSGEPAALSHDAQTGATAPPLGYRLVPRRDAVRTLAFWEERTVSPPEARPRHLVASVRRQRGRTTLIGSMLEERSGDGITRIQLEPSRIPSVLHERFGISLDDHETRVLQAVVAAPA